MDTQRMPGLVVSWTAVIIVPYKQQLLEFHS